jgi:hypothetical protein
MASPTGAVYGVSGLIASAGVTQLLDQESLEIVETISKCLNRFLVLFLPCGLLTDDLRGEVLEEFDLALLAEILANRLQPSH